MNKYTEWMYGNNGVKRRRWFVFRQSLMGRGSEIVCDARGRYRLFERWESAARLAKTLNNTPSCDLSSVRHGAKQMEQEHRGRHFAWNYDARLGVGNFERLGDGALSYLETGSDCANRRREFNRLKSKTSSPRYPKAAPTFEEVFDAIASEYIFDA